MVFSLWKDDACIGTFRLKVAGVPRLLDLLARAVTGWATEMEQPAEPSAAAR